MDNSQVEQSQHKKRKPHVKEACPFTPPPSTSQRNHDDRGSPSHRPVGKHGSALTYETIHQLYGRVDQWQSNRAQGKKNMPKLQIYKDLGIEPRAAQLQLRKRKQRGEERPEIINIRNHNRGRSSKPLRTSSHGPGAPAPLANNHAPSVHAAPPPDADAGRTHTSAADNNSSPAELEPVFDHMDKTELIELVKVAAARDPHILQLLAKTHDSVPEPPRNTLPDFSHNSDAIYEILNMRYKDLVEDLSPGLGR